MQDLELEFRKDIAETARPIEFAYLPPSREAQPSLMTAVLARVDEPTTRLIETTSIDSSSTPRVGNFDLNSSPYLSGLGSALTFLAVLSLGAWVYYRLKTSTKIAGATNKNSMKILQVLPVGPKRQILLVQVGANELVLANTEQGLSLLVSETHPPRVSEIHMDTSRKEAISVEVKSEAPPSLQEAVVTSGMTSNQASATSEHTVSQKQSNRQSFPRYLAKSFLNESQTSTSKSPDQENIDNVTNMIRQKLKDMRKMS